MTSNLSNAILITVIGMGLVFIALLLLWGAMALLMRFANKQKDVEAPEVEVTLQELRKRAAIAAVVVALIREADTELHEFPLPPTAFVSAWQAVMRSNMFKKRGNVR